MPQYVPRRNFDPAFSARYGRPTFAPDQLVKYSPKWQRLRLFNFPFRGSHWRPRMNTLVVMTDGTCRSNERDAASSKASFGAYFGPGCRHNKFGRLAPELPQTSSRAKLEAVRQALHTIRGMYLLGGFKTFRHTDVVIQTDSAHVYNIFNRWIWLWVSNGFVTVAGDPVVDRPVIQEIHDLISFMEKNLNMSVRFWRVDRQWISAADQLADRAFDGEFTSVGPQVSMHVNHDEGVQMIREQDIRAAVSLES